MKDELRSELNRPFLTLPAVLARAPARARHAARRRQRSRACAAPAPRNIALKRAGKVIAEAIAWFGRVDRFIL
jgi:hypothetical protein